MRKLMIIIVSLFIGTSIYSKHSTINESRQAQFNYKINQDTEISIKGKNTYLKIDTWNKNEVSIIATIEFKGKETEDMVNFLEEFSSYVENKIAHFNRELIIDTSFLFQVSIFR